MGGRGHGGYGRYGRSRLWLPASVLLAAAGCGQSGEPADDGGAPDASVFLPVPHPPTVTSPTVTAVRFPAHPSGDIALDLTIAGARGGIPRITVDVSRDGGDTFHPAGVEPAGGTTVPAPGHAALVWHSLDDIGFRGRTSVKLRFAVTDDVGVGPPALFDAPDIDNLRAAARRVDWYLASYGRWDASSIAVAQRYQLVITHTRDSTLTRQQIASMQQGVDPLDPADDTLVLCYVSVGEDLRTGGIGDAQFASDPRFRGDGTGPRIDPRGPNADGGSLLNIDPRGLPSNGGTGYASYYLDDNSVKNSPDHRGDGIPDKNAIFGARFVNAGDPAWFDTIDAMTRDSSDRVMGLREVLTPNYGRGLDCDGVFLDTIDTAAPNSYTDASSANQSEFEWTAPGFTSFIRRIHDTYPDKLILQNRGLFFFDPRHPQYEVNARGAIDFLMYESYRLNSSTAEQWNPYHYGDNRYNVAPKLMAEANRPDGFRVLSLGYAAGPPDEMSSATLLGQSTLGFDSLIEDIHVTQDLAGFRHYLTDPAVLLVNEFVRMHASLDDHDPPVWTSTYNDQYVSPPVAPTPRVGIQQAVGGGGVVTVRWDVALDKNRVHYVLYAQPRPFDFAADPRLAGATRIVLSAGTVPDEYQEGVGRSRYPFEATLSAFPARQKQYLIIRAADESPAANEDDNTVVLTATP